MATLTFNRIDLAKSGKAVIFGFDQSMVNRAGTPVRKQHKGVTVDQPPHEDLCNVFLKFVPHLLYSIGLAKIKITRPEFYLEYKFLDDDQFKNILVTGVIVHHGKGEDESLKIKLIGQCTNDNDEISALNSPWIDLYDDSSSRYELQSIAADNYKLLIEEADAYYNKDKYAPNPQQELEFG